MALYTPVIQEKYVQSKFLNAPKWSDLIASGIVDFSLADELAKGGEYVNAPKLIHVPDFTHADISSDTPVSPTRVASNDDKYPVVRFHSLSSWKDSDNTLTGEKLDQLVSESFGEKMAARALELFGITAKAATPSAHTLTVATAPTLQILRKLKFQAGDHAEEFTTLVCHSNIWNAIIADILSTYTSNSAITAGIMSGDPKITYQVLGVSKIILSDKMPKTAGGFSSSIADDTFTSFLCRAGAMRCGWQRTPTLTLSAPDVTVPGTLRIAKCDGALAIGPRAMKYTGSANPSDSTLGNASNWSASYSDAREHGVLALVSVGTATT